MFLTEIQFAKMENDIIAFFSAAQKLETEINEIHFPDFQKKDYMSDTAEAAAFLAYSTVMQVNLGLSIELTLKKIIYMSGHPKCIKSHILCEIYDLLNCGIKKQLESEFTNWQVSNPLKSWVKNTNTLRHGVEETYFNTFLELLQFFDKHGLFGERYSFENFSIEERQEITMPAFIERFFYILNNKQWHR